MPFKAAIAAVVVTVMSIMGLSLYLTGKAYLAERDKGVELRHTLAINELTEKFKEEKQQDLAALMEANNLKITELETLNRERENDLTTKLLNARNDALQKPIEFGDNLIRELIYTDCLWSKGAAGNGVQGRTACRSEAANANPASANFSFTVLTPTFLTGWADACDDWKTLGTTSGAITYTRKEWEEEYNNFDPMLCEDVLVAATPELSIFLQRLMANGQSYTSQLIEYALEQNEIIEILTKKQEP